MQKPRIVVIGSSNTDMVVKTATLPKPGETVTGGTFLLAPGGKGANQAVAAARLEADVIFVSAVGNDLFGQQAIAGYKREAIDTSLIQVIDSEATGVALILVDNRGENLISVASGANHLLLPERMNDAVSLAVGGADLVVMQLETPLETILWATEKAYAAGVPVILDPAPAPESPLPTELLKKLYCIKPNEWEAQKLTGIEVTDLKTAQQAADALLDSGVKIVIITLGSQGALVAAEKGKGEHIPATKVEAVDTTAAGDAFSGALAVGLGREMEPAEAARFAAAVAAISVTKMGAQPSLPTLKEVLSRE